MIGFFVLCLILKLSHANTETPSLPPVITVPLTHLAVPDEWKFLVWLKCSPVGEGRFCFGTIIHARWILTSAYCVTRGPCNFIIVDISEFYQPSVIAKYSFQLRHPEYEVKITRRYPELSWYSFNDIALVQLLQPMNFSDKHYKNAAVAKLASIPPVLDYPKPCKSVHYQDWLLRETIENILPCDVIRSVFKYMEAERTVIARVCMKYVATNGGTLEHPDYSSAMPLVRDGKVYAIFDDTKKVNDNNSVALWTLVPDHYMWIDAVLKKHQDNLL